MGSSAWFMFALFALFTVALATAAALEHWRARRVERDETRAARRRLGRRQAPPPDHG